MNRLLRVLKIETKEVKYISIAALIFLVLLIYQIWNFKQSPLGLSSQDVAFYVSIGIFDLIIILVAGWLGFTQAGRRYFANIEKAKEAPAIRISKVFFGAAALGFAGFIILFVALLFIGGAETVSAFFDARAAGIIYISLALVCLPIALKYMK